MKALLLGKDYAQYKPQLRSLGHNLPKVAAAARHATGLHIFTHGTLEELKTLSKFYQEHLLRYASRVDIYIDPRTIPSRRVLRHGIALIKHIERGLVCFMKTPANRSYVAGMLSRAWPYAGDIFEEFQSAHHSTIDPRKNIKN
ncbi:MAG: hypothetical protein ABIT70_06230 [Sulfuriferula sp.]